MDVVEKHLKKVNPDFHFYTNDLATCDIIKNPSDMPGLMDDADTRDNLKYVWSKPEKTYRGILYCIPEKLNINRYKLREWNSKNRC